METKNASLFDFFDDEASLALARSVIAPVIEAAPPRPVKKKWKHVKDINGEPDRDLFGQVVARTLMDREKLAQSLRETFKGITLETLVPMLTNEFTELIEYARLCKEEDACRRTSLLFNPHRLDVRCGGNPSVFEALQDEKLIRGMARVILLKENKVSDLLYQVLQGGFNWVQWCAEFAPIAAVRLCRRYSLNADSKVLDPCAGWGGRMLGVSTLVNDYTCCDPSTKTVTGLQNLCTFIQRLQPSFTAHVFNLPFEDSTEIPDYYDMALTSPPYYDTEKYSDELTNSLNRYHDFETWCRRFYLPMIDKVMRQLKPGGVFVLNIGDRKYPLSKRMQAHCEGRYPVERIENLLGYNSGLGRQGDLGEKFYEIKRPV